MNQEIERMNIICNIQGMLKQTPAPQPTFEDLWKHSTEELRTMQDSVIRYYNREIGRNNQTIKA